MTVVPQQNNANDPPTVPLIWLSVPATNDGDSWQSQLAVTVLTHGRLHEASAIVATMAQHTAAVTDLHDCRSGLAWTVHTIGVGAAWIQALVA